VGAQFNRFCDVTVHDRLLKGLDVDFTITRSLDVTANTAELLIYNLSEASRKHLAQQATDNGVVCKIDAGYREDPFAASVSAALTGIVPDESPQIFLGEMRTVTSVREGADWITRLSAGDGDQLKKQRVSFSVGPGASFQSVVNKMVDGVKAGVKDSARALLKGEFAEVGKALTEGFSVDGYLGDELPRVLRSGGLEMSVQNGQLQILPIGKALGDVAIKLTPNTGLVGSPEVGNKGRVTVRCLLTSKVYPGRKIKVESQNVTGVYRCHTITYAGQTAGNDWYCDIEAEPIR
jgi:hypothetical protein